MSKAVVVIEDDPDMQELIRLALRPQPQLHLVGHAECAEEGLALVEREQPDLVILNHYLEAGSLGLPLAPALKRVAPRAKLVLFSSYDLAIEADHESAVDVFVSKRRLGALLPTVSSLLDLAG
jgi:DNA-binding NarL/FixJ family response regulator